MIIIDSVETTVHYLSEGYMIAKVTAHYPGMTTECRIAGMLMGITTDEWWFTLLHGETCTVHGIVNKTLFVELYQQFYISEQESSDANMGKTYTLSDICPVQEFPRYKRKLDCWTEYTSKPEPVH